MFVVMAELLSSEVLQYKHFKMLHSSTDGFS